MIDKRQMPQELSAISAGITIWMGRTEVSNNALNDEQGKG
jgi:hypothetical protein